MFLFYMAFLCCVEMGKVKFNEVKGSGTMKVTFPKTWELCGFLLCWGVNFFFFIAIQKQNLKPLSKMDKYHHTAIRICKRKEHKAAPRKSRHAKNYHIEKGDKKKLKSKCRWLQMFLFALYWCKVNSWENMVKRWTETWGQLDAL